MDQHLEAELDRLEAELDRLADDIAKRLHLAEASRKRYTRAYYSLAITATLATAFAGFGGLAGLFGSTATSIIVLLAAVVIAFQSTLGVRLKETANDRSKLASGLDAMRVRLRRDIVLARAEDNPRTRSQRLADIVTK